MEFRASPWHVGGEFSSPAEISQLELSVEPTYVYAGLFLASPELWDACVRASLHRDGRSGAPSLVAAYYRTGS